jgi:endonuclease/exonuclease/phosphatase family metal-dependent hydrolase
MPIITTWNCQGDPTTNLQKRIHLQKLWRDSDVLLLQECGQLKNLRLVDFGSSEPKHTMHAGQYGAYNSRCSVAILSKVAVKDAFEVNQSSSGRSALGIDVGGCWISTLHALSGGVGAVDVEPLASQLSRKGKPFILGGDFNFEFDYDDTRYFKRNRVNLGSTSRQNWQHCTLTQMPTHQGGKRLDWFIHSTSISGSAQRSTVKVSDHWAVLLNISKH